MCIDLIISEKHFACNLFNKSINHILLIFILLFIALQAGDEVVMVNGNLVEGMTSTEVVGIIKAAEGDIAVVAKRGAAVVATAVGSEAPPGKCPAGGVWGTIKYAGPKTKRNACIACLCCGPLVSTFSIYS